MKFLDHPLFLFLVFFVCGAGTIGVLLIVIQGVVEGLPFRWAAVIHGLLFLWAACSSGSSLFSNKPTLSRLVLEKYTSELMALPYEEAVEKAGIHSTHVPHELALRKIKPSAVEWQAFEKDGTSFLLEKNDPDGKTKITIYK